MGLDMYLEKRTYVKQWNHNPKEQQCVISVKKGGKKHPNIQPKRVSYIIEEVAYWRKANQIHNWFVNNVQGGNDDCKYHYVDNVQIEKLIETCTKVLESLKDSSKATTKVKNGFANGKPTFIDVEHLTNTKVAKELLPTSSGFFFGGTLYDEWYVKDLEETIKTLKPLLKENSGDFYYSSSW